MKDRSLREINDAVRESLGIHKPPCPPPNRGTGGLDTLLPVKPKEVDPPNIFNSHPEDMEANAVLDEFLDLQSRGTGCTVHEFMNKPEYPIACSERLPELIICAANRDPETRKIYLCVRHGCDMFWQQIDDEYGEDFCCQNFEEGFYTNHLRFVCREEAYIIANDNGQIKRLCPTNSNRLYSEMLY